MARIRTIKPEFWADEKIGELSVEARLTFIAMWNLADDEGLLKANPLYLKAQIFAYDNISKEDVDNILGILQEQKLIFIYKDMKQQQYCWIVNFRKHQRIDKPQKPKHPVPSLQNPKVREMYGNRDGWICQICGDEIPHPTHNRSLCLSVDHIQPRSKDGLDSPSNIRAVHFGCNASKKDKEYSQNIPGELLDGKDQGTGIKEQDQGVEKDSPAKRKRFTPPTFQQVSDYFFQKCGDSSEAQKFMDFYASKGWMVGKNKMKDWQAAVRNWISRNNDKSAPIKQQQTDDYYEQLAQREFK